jgi:hypothetical protein
MLQGPLIGLMGGALMLVFGLVTFATGGLALVGWLAVGSAVLLGFSGAVGLLNYLR